MVNPSSNTTLDSLPSISSDIFKDENAEDDMDAWGDMEGDAFFDAPTASASANTVSTANPFDDNGEPDFAGWLAAQSQKKPGMKPLPKGLKKSVPPNSSIPVNNRVASTGVVGGAGAKKAAPTAVKPKPVVAKRVDTAPKAADDDEGWGDGW
jgi:SCY1-like protein 1